MFSLFKRKPKYEDAGLEDLSHMLTGEDTDPTYKRELLSRERLDFSLDSLKHIDEYLEALHVQPPTDQDLTRVVLRCGAYVGEVIRRHSKEDFHWLAFPEAARLSPVVKSLGMGLGTARIASIFLRRSLFSFRTLANLWNRHVRFGSVAGQLRTFALC